MTGWLLRRLATSIGIVFAVVTLTFVLIEAAPGTPFVPPPEQPFDPATIARLHRQYGLDQPLPVRYAKYLGQVARGNLGESFALRRPVAAVLADAIPPTLLLAGTALALDFLLGIALGAFQAFRARRRADVAIGNVTLFLYSVPTFWLGLILLLVFGEWLRWFPVGGMSDPVLCPTLASLGCVADRLWHLVLPAATLGLVAAAGTARYQRAAVLEITEHDFVRAARAKGVPEGRIATRHTLRNALLPVITLFGLAFPFLFTGAVLIETIFAWPGMGRVATEAILRRDYPVVTSAALITSIFVVTGSLVADLLIAVADPRIRVREEP